MAFLFCSFILSQEVSKFGDEFYVRLVVCVCVRPRKARKKTTTLPNQKVSGSNLEDQSYMQCSYLVSWRYVCLGLRAKAVVETASLS